MSKKSERKKRPKLDIKDCSTKDYPDMHSFKISGNNFVIPKHFVPIKVVGRGAYGVVIVAKDSRNGKKVAIKKVYNAFEDVVDGKRILREIKLLQHFSHSNVIRLVDCLDPVPADNFRDVYMVFDYMETDLHKIIYSKNVLSDQHIQYFVYQILRSLKYIHSANVMHRDLKPSNLLLNANCDMKVCDFGLARGIDSKQDYELTEYVVTRWYRAPEIMCDTQQYNEKVDVWAVGCIMAELHGRQPLFPGDDYIKQMNLIFKVLGTPSEDDMKDMSNHKALEYIRTLKKIDKQPLSKLYRKATPLAIDLMERMLTFNPRRRISIDEALKHPYLASLHDSSKEPVCKSQFNFDFEHYEMTVGVLQRFIWDEIYKFHPKLKERNEMWIKEGKLQPFEEPKLLKQYRKK